jgi:polyribonucleotide nucleotidyltransferase
MANVYRVEREIGGKPMIVETGNLAKLADGAVTVTYGETIVLVTVCSAPPRSEEIDYFPLSVDYREKTSAAGKFPGGFMKREGRPSTKETLTSRMIDRPIRPLFPDGYFDEVQILANVLSADQENDPDILAMIGASAALSISSIPFLGPIAACRIARVNGELIVNPVHSQLEEADLNVLIGGHKDAINMIEVEAKSAKEEDVANAIAEAHKTVGVVCGMIDELVTLCGKDKEFTVAEFDTELYNEVKAEIAERLAELKQIREKKACNMAVRELYDNVTEKYCVSESADQAPRSTTTMFKRILSRIEEEVVSRSESQQMLVGQHIPEVHRDVENLNDQTRDREGSGDEKVQGTGLVEPAPERK